MRNCVEGILYVIGGIIRLADLLTDVWYVTTQEFSVSYLYYLSITFIVAPSIFFILIFLYSGLISLCRGNYKGFIYMLAAGLVLAVFDPLGITLFAFGCYLMKKKYNSEDFYVIELVTRSAGFVEGIFESLPQFVIQIYNNLVNDDWNTINILSIGFSVLGVVYTCLKLLHAHDQVQQNGVTDDVVYVNTAAIKTGKNGERDTSDNGANKEEGVEFECEEIYNPELSA